MSELFEVGSAPLARLRERLAARAESEGLVDVAVRSHPSPVGDLLVAATERGVVRVAFGNEDPDQVIEALVQSIGSRLVKGGRRLDAVVAELDRYFAGTLHTFSTAIDWRGRVGWHHQVRLQLQRIEYGHRLSYADLAAAAGRPLAVRAAATACATNPVPIIVGCHRVVRSDGGLGGYRGGLEAKRLLLELERGSDWGTGQTPVSSLRT